MARYTAFEFAEVTGMRFVQVLCHPHGYADIPLHTHLRSFCDNDYAEGYITLSLFLAVRWIERFI